MKVKAAKILWLVADDDCDIFIDFGNDEGDGFHGVKWEVVE